MGLKRYRIDFLVNAPTSRQSWNGFVFIRATSKTEAIKIMTEGSPEKELSIIKAKRML